MRIVGSSENRLILGSLSEEFLKGPITREVLVGMKTRGLRKRVWYGALDRMERGLVDLTIRWVDKVRSGPMTETLMRILEKLAQAMETGMGRVLGRGRQLATRVSDLAVGWGNESAFYWRFEQGFCRALSFGLLS
jgi:hypothetical protein